MGAQLQVDGRTSASSMVGERGTCPKMPLACTGTMQKALEDRKYEITNAELQRIPTTTVELNEEQEHEVHLLLDLIEDDDDITNVWTNIK